MHKSPVFAALALVFCAACDGRPRAAYGEVRDSAPGADSQVPAGLFGTPVTGVGIRVDSVEAAGVAALMGLEQGDIVVWDGASRPSSVGDVARRIGADPEPALIVRRGEDHIRVFLPQHLRIDGSRERPMRGLRRCGVYCPDERTGAWRECGCRTVPSRVCTGC